MFTNMHIVIHILLKCILLIPLSHNQDNSINMGLYWCELWSIIFSRKVSVELYLVVGFSIAKVKSVKYISDLELH